MNVLIAKLITNSYWQEDLFSKFKFDGVRISLFCFIWIKGNIFKL